VEPYENHLSLATAIAIGLLIGLEREQTKSERGGSFAGIRTYPIFALVGALASLLEPVSSWLPLMALLGVFALVAISYSADIRESPDKTDHGVTTEISVIATYLLGSLATSKGVIEPMADRLVMVAGLGVVITFLLSSKQLFHGFAQRVSRDDMFATVKFLIVAVIVVPMLPDRDLGPLGAINPRTVGLMVVTIAGLSFIGYVAMRLYGAKRGLLASAALGGLVSSTAVTLSFAGRTKEHPELAPMAAGAITIAWTIMLGRVVVLVAIVDAELLRTLAIPVGAMILGAILGLLLVFRRAQGNGNEMALKNPFELGSAIKVSLMFALVLLVTKAATEYLGDQGLYLASALAGTTDVDAITVSTAKLARGGLAAMTATLAILIGIAVNTIVKTGLAGGIGGKALGKRTAISAALIIGAGLAGLAATALG
jgi:uncharacterized membrane protein (DUF4010 family)